MTWNLQNSIHLLNDFCADKDTFSYFALSALRLRGLALKVNAITKELTVVVNTEQDYHIVQANLHPNRRMYELLSIHFNKVHIAFGLRMESVEKSIYLETVLLDQAVDRTELRDVSSLGARLRRTMNVALQGHIGVLKLHGEEEIDELRNLWERGRINQLLEKYEIIPFDDANGELIKLWRPRRLEEGENIVVIID